MSNLDSAVNELGVQLKRSNHILTAHIKYLQAYDAARNADCKRGDPPEDDDQQVIEVFVNTCVDALPTHDQQTFKRHVQQAEQAVRTLDSNLNVISGRCQHEEDESCGRQREKALADLTAVLSPNRMALFESDATEVILTAKKRLDACFKDETEGLLVELVDATANLNNCLDTQSSMSKH